MPKAIHQAEMRVEYGRVEGDIFAIDCSRVVHSCHALGQGACLCRQMTNELMGCHITRMPSGHLVQNLNSSQCLEAMLLSRRVDEA